VTSRASIIAEGAVCSTNLSFTESAVREKSIITFHGAVAVFEPEKQSQALMQAAAKDPGVAPAFYSAA